MGFYYGPSTPPGKDGKDGKKRKGNDSEPGGCLEALIITRAAFGALAVPLAVLFGAIIGLVGVLYLFAIHPLLGLLGIVALALGIALFARWERSRFHSGPPM